MVGRKGLFELNKCTVSGLKRQFDKWHLFSAPTPPPSKVPETMVGGLITGGGGLPNLT